MYILEVSYGCPSEKYPLNGIFQMDQAKALSDIGNKVVFAAIDVRSIRKRRRWGVHWKNENNIPVIEFNFPMGPILPRLRARVSKFGFSTVLKKVISRYGKPDIVHVHFGGTAMCVVDCCKRENIPYVVTEHSSAINRDNLTEKEVSSMRYVYQNAAAVIAVSSALAKRIKNYSEISVEVIPNIIDFSSFCAEKKSHEKFHFISAGNLNYGKGFDVLIKAFKECISRGMDATLTIMGDGPERDTIVNEIRRNNLSDSVFLFGSYIRSQFAEELSKSDCFVLASRGETFGVVYAEALACGVPVIATRCGGPEDFVDRTNGLLVDVNDIDGLANAMYWMYQHKKEYNSEQIVNHTHAYFSTKRIAEKITEICTVKMLED